MNVSRWVVLALFGGALQCGAQSIEITHPPYLTIPAVDGVSIGWGTKEKSGAELFLREQGTDSFIPYSQAIGGQLPHANTTHLVRVNGLKPGTTYEYKIANMIPTKPERAYGEAYAQVIQDTVWKFTTLDPAKKQFRTVICTDIHSDADRMVKALRLGGIESSDLAISLGDTSEYLVQAERGVFGGYLNKVGAFLNGAKPLIVARGNHDWRGAESLRWLDFLGTPEKNAYYAFSHGPAFFILLDSGEDKPDKKEGSAYTYFNRSEGYMQAQREWLKKQVASEAFKKAKFRIVLIHIATHGQGNSYPSVRMNKLFADILNKSEADQRIHLMLSGHTHRDNRFNAGSKTPAKGGTGRRPMPEEMTGANFHYPIVTIGNKSVMSMEVTEARIQCKTQNMDGAPIDAFEITPDGKLTEGQ